ncbi:MAG: Ig-like domain-containing protein, partial [Desulfobacteraceae bacterium]|nr:Ig-like domain-containing protein [Desulfobacteraceae bacterium]
MNKGCYRSTKAISWLVVSVALVCLMMGCGERSTKSEGDGEEGGVVITSLVVFPSPVPEGQTGVVDAVIVDDAGNLLSGVEVSFSVSPSNIGHCSPAVDTTDANGSVGTVFTATSPGTGTIRASIEGVASKTVQVEVITSAASAKPLSIVMTPAVLPADGISTSQIKVTVSDTSGNPARDSTVVKFTAGEKFEDVDEDGYFAEGVDELKYDVNQDGRWNPIGFVPLYALTENGEVTVTYVAGLRTGTAYIKVTSEPGGNLLQEDVSLLLVPTDSVAYIVLMPNNPRIQVRGTGGMEATQIRAICYDDN